MTDEPFRIIVTGSRDWTDHVVIHEVLGPFVSLRLNGQRVVVVQGGCRSGADFIAKTWADLWPASVVTSETHDAQWAVPPRKHDKAGPIRNEKMAALGADICLAFPIGDSKRSPGTWDCIQACARHEIPVRIFAKGAP